MCAWTRRRPRGRRRYGRTGQSSPYFPGRSSDCAAAKFGVWPPSLDRSGSPGSHENGPRNTPGFALDRSWIAAVQRSRFSASRGSRDRSGPSRAAHACSAVHACQARELRAVMHACTPAVRVLQGGHARGEPASHWELPDSGILRPLLQFTAQKAVPVPMLLRCHCM